MLLIPLIAFLSIPVSGPDDGPVLWRALDSVRSVRVVTQARGTDPDGTPTWIRAEIRISSEGSLFFDYAHGDERLWAADPDRARLFLRDGHVIEEVPFRRVAVEFPIQEMPRNKTLELQPIWPLLAWWPEGFPIACPSVHGVTTRLPANVAAAERGVDGSEDVLTLQSPQERIELSRSRGFALLRRTWFSETGEPRTSMHVDSFLEVAPGVWFPRGFRVQRHNPEDTSEVRTVEYQVLEASIDDLEPSAFVFEPLPGTYLANANGDGGGRQLVAGGFELMEGYVGLVQAMKPPRTGSGSVLALGALAGLLAVLLGSNLMRRRFP